MQARHWPGISHALGGKVHLVIGMLANKQPGALLGPLGGNLAVDHRPARTGARMA